MREIMKLNDVLQALSETEKVASDDSDNATDADRTELLQTLQRAAEAKGQVKTASTAVGGQPVQDLEKIARSLADAEEESIVKEAHLYGQAVCDGFMARMSQYEEAAGVVGSEKTASYQQPTVYVDDEGNQYSEDEVKLAAEILQQEQTQEKIAHQAINNIEPEAVELAQGFIKKAAHQGYRMSDEQALEKVAETAFSQGYQDTMEKVAEDAYSVGFDETLEKSAQVLQQAGYTGAVDALVKTAFEQGYQDAMEKIAEAAFSNGYNDMHNLVQAVST